VVWLVVWTAVPTLLTGADMPVRARWATGALTATGLTALQVGSVVLLPRIMASAERQFGLLGMVFTLIGWLFAYSAIVVVAATIVQAFSEDENDGQPGKWLRGPAA
jgi:membrane protein